MVDCGSWPNCGGGTDQRLLVIAALVVIGAAPGDAINPLRPVEAVSDTLFTSAFGGTADMARPAAGLAPVENDPKRS